MIMNNIEDKLKNLKTRKLNEDEKQNVWHSILVRHLKEIQGEIQKPGFINIFNFSFRKVSIAILAIVLILGGGGSGVVASSQNSAPGDFLYPLDLAMDKIQINLATDGKKSELKYKLATDRVSKIKNIAKEKKISATSFSEAEIADVGQALTDVEGLIQEDVTVTTDVQKTEEMKTAYTELLIVLDDEANLKISKTDGQIEIEKKDEVAETLIIEETKETNKTEPIVTPTLITASDVTSLLSTDGVENTIPIVEVTEVFCYGEWHTALVCEEKTDITKDTVLTPEQLKIITPIIKELTPEEIAKNKELTESCSSQGGTYDIVYKECVGVTPKMCVLLGGEWNECASACRNDPQAQVCTMQCVQICTFK